MGAMWRSSIPNSVINRIVAHVNRKAWWHVPPQDPMAYSKRGQILRIEFCRGGVLWPTARLWNVEDVFEERPVKAVLWAPPPHDEGLFPRHRGIYPLFACSLRLI
jgi:hypothetical protein